MTRTRIIRDEPFGHRDYYSKIERAWHAMPWGTNVFRRRTDRFDAVSGVFYAPVEYEHLSIVGDLTRELPTTDWIDNAFGEFVRGEFGKTTGTRVEPRVYAPTIVNESTAGLDVLQDFLRRSETEFVYGGLVADVLATSGDDILAAIYNLLCHPALGHRKNRKNVAQKQFADTLSEQLERRDRLTFLLPSFPFKDQNRFRTYSAASTIDLGEIALLIRLHCLALAIYQVHPFGADIVVLSDGLLYAELFGVDEKLALRYREQLRGFRNPLNIQGTVSILDLSELLAKFTNNTEEGSRVPRCTEAIRHRLHQHDGATSELGTTFNVLARGMKWNLSTRDSLRELNDHDAWTVITEMDVQAVSPKLRDLWEAVDKRARNAAVEYASLNLTLKYFNLLARVFPGALRGTVHPKKDQFAIPLSGGLYPWNGVATVPATEPVSTDVRTVALHELSESEVDLVRLDMSGAPLYFALRDDRE
jgi:pyoverdine/dityrosine biosynthesis protein Dit1